MSDRTEMLAKMRRASQCFYVLARSAGCHAFLEFTGLINEFIVLCEAAEARGIDWTIADTHTGVTLPMMQFHMTYLAEKLDCIYGPALADPKLRKAFVKAILYRAEP